MIPPKFLFLLLAAKEMKGLNKRKPSQEELDSYFRECGGPWKKTDLKVNWCGIFQTYLLRKAGVDVYWKMGHGIRNVTGSERKEGAAQIQYFEGNKGIVYGDIVVRDRSVHHFLALGPPDDAGVYQCIEGNYGGITDPLLHAGRNEKNHVDRIKYFYRIV